MKDGAEKILAKPDLVVFDSVSTWRDSVQTIKFIWTNLSLQRTLSWTFIQNLFVTLEDLNYKKWSIKAWVGH